MNRYLKLLHYELFRIRKLYAALFALTLLLQFAGIFLFAHSYLNQVREAMFTESISAADYAAKYGPTSFYRYTTGSLFFTGPIAICASALLLYVFLIWYRDWLGKNMFIYRLLMIPASRMSVYLAKLTAILLLVLGLVAFELLILPLQNAAFNGYVPSDLRYSFSIPDIVATHPLLKILVPNRIGDFLLYYGAGLAGVIVVFTAILFERSFRFKGAIGAVVYGAATVLIFVLPAFVAESAFPNYLYPRELWWMELAIGFLIGCGSLGLSSYLIKNKVTV
ncbi:hypothetical protein SD70_10515 [Gordoniibacillus kamchatkensis]|uniref:ABC-2 family transporter protein n=1 Tax=Gordoniibacillus kamchatkensis TaxID=1590651 RepID=A0ABR5AIK7_9BACL|nr:hypothetical protein [Paenibacillus sp. VKM B-2647]KIL40861.1 hypothetical protein SD70_10515 [Paenibacillus sp. VKM B-2647]